MVIKLIGVAALASGLGGIGAARVKRDQKNGGSKWQAKLYDGNISIQYPAFLSLMQDENKLSVTQFGRLPSDSWIPKIGPGMVSKLDLDVLGTMMNNGALSDDIEIEPFVNTSLLWPNIVSKYENLTVIPDGFLPPFKTKSCIYITDQNGSNGGNVHCATGKKKGFYHEVKWYDFDGDGLKDMLTSRTIKTGPIWDPKFTGELIWYKNPGRNHMLEVQWEENIIVEGPDVIFYPKEYGPGYAVFASEFFSKRIVVHFLSSDGKFESTRIIDDSESLGSPFSVELVDIDGDGQQEILATNHEDSIEASAVFAYTMPSDLKDGAFERHTLATNIFDTVDKDKPGMASPGFAHAFYPRINQTSGRKHLVVSGDGAHDVWFLRPTGDNFEDYEPIRVDNWKGTTGQMLLHDFSGDGIMDVLVPDNDQWTLRAFTFEQVFEQV
jgi:hypothetical protein